MADYKTITYPVSPLEKGQQTKADSVSVTIASDQDPIPVTGSISASNPSVSTVGATPPTSATFIAGTDVNGLELRPIGVQPGGAVRTWNTNPWFEVHVFDGLGDNAITSTYENSKAGLDVNINSGYTGVKGLNNTGNSTATPLTANDVFTGTWIDITNYNGISLNIYADQASATDGLVAQFSYDGVTVHHEHKYSYTTAGIGIGYNLTAEFKYYRVKYTNGSVAQTDFKLQTILKSTSLSPSMYKITNTLTDNSQAIVTRSVITGVTTGGGGGYVNVKVNPSGALVADVTGTVAATQSGTWNINNVSGTVSLPTGAATSANQTTANSSLSSIDGKLTSVTVGTLPSLPTGSNTIGNVNVNGTVPVSGTVTANAGTGTFAISAASLPLPSGAAQDSTVSTMSGKLPATLGQKTSANSLAVTIASDQSSVKIAQTNSKGEFVRNDYTSTSVTTSAYVQLIASTASAYSAIEIFDSSGQTLKLAIGGAGAEVDQFIIFPGGNGRIPFTIASGSRISIRALSATANSGEIDINLYV